MWYRAETDRRVSMAAQILAAVLAASRRDRSDTIPKLHWLWSYKLQSPSLLFIVYYHATHCAIVIIATVIIISVTTAAATTMITDGRIYIVGIRRENERHARLLSSVLLRALCRWRWYKKSTQQTRSRVEPTENLNALLLLHTLILKKDPAWLCD